MLDPDSVRAAGPFGRMSNALVLVVALACAASEGRVEEQAAAAAKPAPAKIGVQALFFSAIEPAPAMCAVCQAW